jgi:hypothetical protein
MARIAEINSIAPGIGEKYANWLPRSDESYRYWTFFEASDYKLLPFAGGLADQPEWLLKDFDGFIEMTYFFNLLVESEELSKPDV